ncbi:O-antigen ligase family protein [Vibrio sp.]|uniref:O-antigen ligase family protein n=1 Tax=Vibrio sp. TaxID=678 RepID=UPI003AA81380
MSTRYQEQSTFKTQLVNLSVLCAFTSLLIIGKGHNVSGVFLLLPALFLAFPIKKTDLPKNFWTLTAIFIAFFSISVLSFLFKGGNTSDFDQPSRFIFVLLVILMLIKYPPKVNFIILGVTLSSILALIVAIIHTQYYGMNRAFTGINDIAWMKGYMPIQDGGIVMTMGLLCGNFFIYSLKNQQYKIATFTFIGCLCGLAASLMSGSRGAWIALPVVFIYLVYSHRHYFRNKAIILLPMLFLSLFIFSALQSEHVMNRVNQASQDIQKLESGNLNSSVGVRVMLWKSAILATKEYPIFGSGYPQRLEIRKEQVNTGVMPKLLNKWRNIHAHNQFLEYLSVYGIVGFISLISVFLYPLYLFKRMEQTSPEHNILKECGVIHILATMSYCLTQVFFAHNSGTIFYPLILSIFLISSGAIKLNHSQGN